eukprot:scaffold2484_cov196-Alexandrium_tamarense.AAC.3
MTRRVEGYPIDTIHVRYPHIASDRCLRRLSCFVGGLENGCDGRTKRAFSSFSRKEEPLTNHSFPPSSFG